MPLVDSLGVVALGATAFVLGDSLTVYFACDTHTTLAACSRAEASTPATWADVRVGHGGLLEPEFVTGRVCGPGPGGVRPPRIESRAGAALTQDFLSTGWRD
jgi:hypothetical protein